MTPDQTQASVVNWRDTHGTVADRAEEGCEYQWNRKLGSYITPL